MGKMEKEKRCWLLRVRKYLALAIWIGRLGRKVEGEKGFH